MSLFFKAKNERIAKNISIKSPTAFRKSVRTLRRGGINTYERRSLVLAKNRAAAQLNRKNLSRQERVQFRKIANMRV